MSSPIFVKQATVGTITFASYNASGVQVNFDATPVFAIYGDHSDTPQLTGTAAELTLTSGFTRPGGSVSAPGIHHIQLNFATADTNFWTPGRHYTVVVNTGSINEVSYADDIVHNFQYEDIASKTDLVTAILSEDLTGYTTPNTPGDKLRTLTSDSIAQLESDVAQLLADVAAVKADTVQTISDVAAVDADTDQLLTDVAAANADTDQLLTDVAAVKADTAQTLTDVADVDADVVVLDGKVVSVQTSLSTLVQDIHEEDVSQYTTSDTHGERLNQRGRWAAGIVTRGPTADIWNIYAVENGNQMTGITAPKLTVTAAGGAVLINAAVLTEESGFYIRSEGAALIAGGVSYKCLLTGTFSGDAISLPFVVGRDV